MEARWLCVTLFMRMKGGIWLDVTFYGMTWPYVVKAGDFLHFVYEESWPEFYRTLTPCAVTLRDLSWHAFTWWGERKKDKEKNERKKEEKEKERKTKEKKKKKMHPWHTAPYFFFYCWEKKKSDLYRMTLYERRRREEERRGSHWSFVPFFFFPFFPPSRFIPL